jgi:Outer membrane protein beta-barrel domain
MRRIACAIGVMLALAASQVFAQGFRHEISGGGSYQSLSRNGVDTKTGQFGIAYGYYFTPQVVGTLGLNYVTTDDGTTKRDFTDLEVGAKYYFGTGFRRGALVPFADAAIGLSDTPSDTDTRFRLGVGASYFLNDSTSIDPSLSYVNIATSGGKTDGFLFGVRLTARF